MGGPNGSPTSPPSWCGRVDVIVANINPAIQAAQKATKTIPIVMMLSVDPVGLGFVASLARPGGNITGMTTQAPELAGKRLQFLKEATLRLSRVAVLWDPAEPSLRPNVREAEVAAAAFGVQRQLVEARSAGELGSAFTAMIKERADAVYLQGNSMQFVNRAQLAEHAVKTRLPMVCPTARGRGPRRPEAGRLPQDDGAEKGEARQGHGASRRPEERARGGGARAEEGNAPRACEV